MRWLEHKTYKSRPTQLAVKRLKGDLAATFNYLTGEQREDETTLLEVHSERTRCNRQAATTRVVKHWSRLLRDVVETLIFQLFKIFAKYNPKLPHLTSKLALLRARG